MSSKIDTLEPDGGEPLADWLASFARAGRHPREAPADSETAADIVRQAEQAIAGVPLGAAGGDDWSRWKTEVQVLVAAGLKAGASILQSGLEFVRRAIAMREVAAAYLSEVRVRLRATVRLRHGFGPRFPLAPIAARANVRLLAAVGALAVASSLVVVTVCGRLGSPTPAPSALPGEAALPARAASAPAPEERPAAGPGVAFSQANLRYCIFQQIRLEALGPVTEGADLVVFNAQVEDWNARCTRYRYRSAEKDAVEGEAAARRALLEVEGRAFMNGWRRKIATTFQQAPAAAGFDAGENAAAPAREAVERLPLLITQGRATADEPDRDSGLSFRTPSLALLRADVAVRVQRRLNDLGYTISPADGTWGMKSRNALRRFKEANGLLGNDAFDAETVTRLFSTSALTAAASGQPDDGAETIETAYPPPPAAGMNPLNRAEGQRIQRRLAELGYYTGHGDGSWGMASRNALRNFKAANGLADDDAWNAMAEAVLFDEQATRAADAPVAARTAAPPSPVIAAVPLPPKRPPPPAAPRAAEPAPSSSAALDAPRPPGLIPAPATRVTGVAPRPSP